MDLIGLTVAKLFSTSLFEREGEAIQSVDLGPIHEPDAVQFSFDTPGWYILGGLLFLSTVLFFVRWLKHFQKNAYRRKALNDIKIIETQQQNESCINDVFVLLRIVAMTAFGRKSVARLYGNSWLQFLESKGKNTPFTQHKDYILDCVYKGAAVDKNKNITVIGLSKKWIKTHA